MDSSVLVVPVRVAAPAELSKALRDYVELNYKQHSAQFIQDGDALQSLRAHAVASLELPAQNSLPHLAAYYAQLAVVTLKFPAEVDAILTWTSSLGYATAPVQSSSLQFDTINIVYNVGAKYSQWAEEFIGSDLKGSFQRMQFAAGSFQELLDVELPKLPHLPPNGLDQATIRCLIAVHLAQAQECFWARARSDNVKSSVLAKLAEGTSYLYSQARNYSDKTSAVTAEFVVQLQAKEAHFAATAQFRQSLDNLEKAEYGEEVARLQLAKNICNKALREYDENPKGSRINPLVTSNLAGLRDKVSGDLARAEKDNDLIYLKAVPSRLPPISKTVVAKAERPTELQVSPGLKPLFQFLLPFSVAQAPLAYKERLDSYVHTYITDEIRAVSKKVESRLADYNLPGILDVVDRPDAVPTTLLDAHDELVQQGGIRNIKEIAQDLGKFSLSSRQRLDAAVREMRRARDRTPLGVPGFPELEGGYNELSGYLDTATRGDQVVASKISNSEHLLEILLKGRPGIEAFLPKGSSTTQAAATQATADVKRLVNGLVGANSHRKDLLQQIEVTLNGTDLSSPIYEFVEKSNTPITEPRQLEPVYIESMQRFDQYLDLVKSENSTTDGLLLKLDSAYARFMAQLSQSDQQSKERNEAVSALQHAFYQYKQILSNLEEGRVFYNALAARIGMFEENVQEYISECEEVNELPKAPEREMMPSVSETLEMRVDTPSPTQAGPPLHNENEHEDDAMGQWTPGAPIRFG